MNVEDFRRTVRADQIVQSICALALEHGESIASITLHKKPWDLVWEKMRENNRWPGDFDLKDHGKMNIMGIEVLRGET